MTKLLKKAFDELAKLPAKEQNAYARRLLEEIEDERLWQEKFARSPHILEQLAEEARREHRVGLTKPLDFKRRGW